MVRFAELASVAAGGAIGSCARYLVGVVATRWLGAGFPWATAFVNTTGALAIGFLAVLVGEWWRGPKFRLFWMVGLLGGYTTFSSYAIEGVQLWERGRVGRSLLFLGGSVFLGFVAVLIGMAVGMAVVRGWTTPGAVVED